MSVTSTADTRARRRPLTRRAMVPWAFLAPFGLLFLALFVAPICYAIYQSFLGPSRAGELGLGGVTDVFVGFENYLRALGSPDFQEAVGRVLLFAVVQVPLMIVLATGLALLLDSASVRWPAMFRSMYFLPYGVPGVIATILWGFLYVPGISPIVSALEAFGVTWDPLGQGSVLWSIANIVIWQCAGYNMLVVTAQLQSISGDYYEAAQIDGARPWQVIWYVKLPLIRPALVLTTVFSIIGTLQLFSEPLVLKPLSAAISFTYTPNLAAYNEAFNNNNYGQAAADAVLLALGAFVLSFGFLRVIGARGRG